MPVDLWRRIRRAGRAIGAIAWPPLGADADAAGTAPAEPGDDAPSARALRLERARRVAAEGELEDRARLERLIQRGVAVDTVLAGIASALTQSVGAEFVAIGRAGLPAGSGIVWAGAPSWRAQLAQQPKFSDLWTAALEEGVAVEAGAESLGWHRGDGALHEERGEYYENYMPGDIVRVLALPLAADAAPLGVLIAGLGISALGDEARPRIESYAALAAMALDREESASHTAFLAAAFHRWLETTSEQLLLVDSAGRIERASRAAREALSLGAPLAGGARLEDLFADATNRGVAEWLDGLAPKRADGSFSAISSRRAFATRPADRLFAPNSADRLFAAPPRGAILRGGAPVRLTLRAQWPGAGSSARSWLVAIEDLGPQRISAADEERAASELSGVLDALDSGVLVFHDSGRIRAMNDRFAHMIGVDPRAARELETFERVVETLSPHFANPAEFAERWRERRNRADESARDVLEFAGLASKIIERASRPVRDSHGNRLGWIEIYREITSQHAARSKDVQTEKMASLGQLVSGIAHELNNPLTSIQGYAQLLLSRRNAQDQLADAKHIAEESERAGRIVKNLLLFAREAKLERRAVDLNAVVERALALRSYELKLEVIETSLDLDPRLPAILADAGQLLQVVLNLVLNAEQAIAESRGPSAGAPPASRPHSAHAAARDHAGAIGHIRIRTHPIGNQRLALEISDDGPGIPPDAIPRIFDPFFTTKSAGAGTGLGLSLVRTIVQEHGGEISVDSGRGATFTIEFPAFLTDAITVPDVVPRPLTADSVAMPPPAVISTGKTHRIATHGERVLVVEDEPTVAQLISDVLTEDGYRVDKLLDSREALDRARTHDYDLIVCDLKMPHVDGRAFYRALTEAESPMRNRFVFVTGDTLSPRTLEFLESSGVPYLAKPFLVEELQQVVQQAFARVRVELPRVAGGSFWPRAIMRKR